MQRRLFNDDNKLLVTIELEFMSDKQLQLRNVRDKVSRAYSDMLHEISLAENKYTEVVRELLKP